MVRLDTDLNGLVSEIYTQTDVTQTDTSTDNKGPGRLKLSSRERTYNAQIVELLHYISVPTSKLNRLQFRLETAVSHVIVTSMNWQTVPVSRTDSSKTYVARSEFVEQTNSEARTLRDQMYRPISLASYEFA